MIKDIFKKIIGRSNTSRFIDSNQYWKDRYKSGGNSGSGSYNNLAEFKAEVLNDFVEKKKVKTVLEYGCGDGNQLKYLAFDNYVGLDISKDAIKLCRKTFSGDKSKEFFVIENGRRHSAEMVLSLDVLYHLVEDHIFDSYMKDLFASSTKYVVIYSGNFDNNPNFLDHVKPRVFTNWIDKNAANFTLYKHIPNKYPKVKGQEHDDNQHTSFADFYIYERIK